MSSRTQVLATDVLKNTAASLHGSLKPSKIQMVQKQNQYKSKVIIDLGENTTGDFDAPQMGRVSEVSHEYQEND